MADDIVTLLRMPHFDGEVNELELEAADEIERLRKLTSRLAQLMMPYALLMTREEQQEVMKAVNGD